MCIRDRTTCVTATDTFGIDGKVVLLERGTKLVGETRGQVQQGSARVFVLWTEARTPTGVIVPLDSPGADELGRSGLPGSVERHFWERFGAALVISTIDGAVQAGVQASSRGNGTIIYNPSATQDVMTESLKSTAVSYTHLFRSKSRGATDASDYCLDRNRGGRLVTKFCAKQRYFRDCSHA